MTGQRTHGGTAGRGCWAREEERKKEAPWLEKGHGLPPTHPPPDGPHAFMTILQTSIPESGFGKYLRSVSCVPGALLSSLLQHYDTKAQKEAVTCPVHRAKKKKTGKAGTASLGLLLLPQGLCAYHLSAWNTLPGSLMPLVLSLGNTFHGKLPDPIAACVSLSQPCDHPHHGPPPQGAVSPSGWGCIPSPQHRLADSRIYVKC